MLAEVVADAQLAGHRVVMVDYNDSSDEDGEEYDQALTPVLEMKPEPGQQRLV